MLTHQFSSVTLYRNRTVRYSARMHAIIACQMEFQLYPMDIQLCPVYIESCESPRQAPRCKVGSGSQGFWHPVRSQVRRVPVRLVPVPGAL